MRSIRPRLSRLTPGRQRLLLYLLLIPCLLVIAYGAMLFFLQRRIIYHPIPYEPAELRMLPKGVETVEYQTKCGRQVAFYVAPSAPAAMTEAASAAAQVQSGQSLAPDTAAPQAPATLWVMFTGNASRALDWTWFLEHVQDSSAYASAAARDGFLLVDYPGYGACAGEPTRSDLNANGPAALEALAERIGVVPDRLMANLGVVGYSLGSAAALEFAVKAHPRRIILLSPFTTLLAMARRTVLPPFHYLLVDRFDNVARLAELARLDPRPAVTILHGSDDTLIPVEMSRELVAPYAGWIDLRVLPGGTHGDIIDLATPDLLRIMFSGGNAPSAVETARVP